MRGARPNQKNEQPSTRRVRRSSEEVRARVLVAARDLFTERGYAAVTTQDIAARAGVVEPILFRHFGSKAGLLEHTFIEDFSSFIDVFIDRWQNKRQNTTLLSRTEDYIAGVLDLVAANRVSLTVLLAARAEESSSSSRIAQVLDGLFSRMLTMILADVAPYEPVTKRTRAVRTLRLRMTFGLITSMVLLEDWLFASPEDRPDRDEMIKALVAYVTAGLPGEALRAKRSR